MSGSSWNKEQTNLKNKTHDIQGGEKKVMKKSLKVIATATLAFSMFASVAMADTPATTTPATTTSATTAVKTSKDFTDLVGKDAALLAKIDALLAKGFMDGKSDTAFDIDGNMTRAEAAKLVAKIFGLTVGTETTSSFKDVDGTDASQAWAIPFIEAAKKAGIIDGMTDTTFAPQDNVTLGQLATLLVKGFGKAADVKTTSPWYDGYLDVAKANGVDLGTDGAKAATRADLVTGSYAADVAFSSIGKLSVLSAKAAGATTVEVKLSKAADTAKATFTLKKGAADVALDAAAAKWSDDKKTVTLKLKDSKVTAGSYTVTLAGVDAAELDKTTATFDAENEKVTKIEFVSANDTIAKSDKARVQVQPTNQYGEAASFSAGNYTVYATTPDAATLSKSDDGKLYVILDTNYTGVIPNNSQVSINIYDNDQHISATKLFKVGDVPYVTKVELGAVTYKNGKEALSLAGEKAIVKLTQYDQYGGVVTKDTGSAITPTVFVTPYADSLGNTPAVIADDNNDNTDDVVFTLLKDVDKTEEFTVTVFGGGSQATAKVKASASKVASKVEVLQPSTTFAYGDKDKYVEIVAYDEAGNKLTADDIVDNAKAGRFKITTSSNLVLGGSTDVPAAMLVNGSADATQDNKIVLTGPNKGKLHIKKVDAKGQGNVFVAIYGNGVNSNAQINIPLADVRYPDSIRVVTEVAAKAVATAKTKPKYQVFDQYSEKITGFSTDSAGTTIDILSNNKVVTYDVYADLSATAGFKVSVDGTGVIADNAILPISAFSDKEITIATDGTAVVGSTFDFKFQLRKSEATHTGQAAGTLIDQSVANLARKVTILTAEEAKNLTYSLNALGDLFNTRDDATYIASHATEVDATTSKLAKEVVVSAKDAAGNSVAIPKTITAVTSDVYNFAQVDKATSAVDALTGVVDDKAYVIGYKVGTANITAYFKAANGEAKSVSGQVVVKNEANRVESISVGSASKTYTFAQANGENIYHLMNKLTVKNQYGNEFKSEGSFGAGSDVVALYDNYLQVRYTITDLTGFTSVTLNGTNQVSLVGATSGSFVVTAVAPNGKTATTTVVVTP
ncbi:hypothetical protein ASG89_29175 [Paenibacillus sp. Soil766]|uniref:S-layer homology domain-containing protein n=1 Tax=Paenibacillus sp. Soil766 TaxID=1736404 RepID=UPI00070FD18B|nr:S-layer homology domain-containing protein [Paenibacillus sp. Soil766]KRE97976.1 hypothetical protein ASG89_29175 [Paenibacillus sp. Soil766]